MKTETKCSCGTTVNLINAEVSVKEGFVIRASVCSCGKKVELREKTELDHDPYPSVLTITQKTSGFYSA